MFAWEIRDRLLMDGMPANKVPSASTINRILRNKVTESQKQKTSPQSMKLLCPKAEPEEAPQPYTITGLLSLPSDQSIPTEIRKRPRRQRLEHSYQPLSEDEVKNSRSAKVVSEQCSEKMKCTTQIDQKPVLLPTAHLVPPLIPPHQTSPLNSPNQQISSPVMTSPIIPPSLHPLSPNVSSPIHNMPSPAMSHQLSGASSSGGRVPVPPGSIQYTQQSSPSCCYASPSSLEQLRLCAYNQQTSAEWPPKAPTDWPLKPPIDWSPKTEPMFYTNTPRHSLSAPTGGGVYDKNTFIQGAGVTLPTGIWTRGSDRQIMPPHTDTTQTLQRHHADTTQTLHRHHSETTHIHRQHTESVWSETRTNHVVPAWNGINSTWVSSGSSGFGAYADAPHRHLAPYQTIDPLDQRLLAHQNQNRSCIISEPSQYTLEQRQDKREEGNVTETSQMISF